MAGIGASLFYRKKLITCVPSNNKDSDGSSDSDNDFESHEKSQAAKKKIQKSCLVEVPEESDDSESSHSAPSRWSKKGVRRSNIVIPESESSTLSTVSSPCISPANLSSPSGSVSTLPPSPSTVRRLKEMKNSSAKSTKKTLRKPSVTLQDRYNPNSSARAPAQLSRTQPACTQSARAQTSRRELFPDRSKLPSKSKVNEPSGRAKKIFDAAVSKKPLSDSNINNTVHVFSPQKKAKEICKAAGPKKPLSDANNNKNANELSPPKKIVERKRSLKRRNDKNKENYKIMKPAATSTLSSQSLLLSSSPDTSSQADKGQNEPASDQMASPTLSPVTPAPGRQSFLKKIESDDHATTVDGVNSHSENVQAKIISTPDSQTLHLKDKCADSGQPFKPPFERACRAPNKRNEKKQQVARGKLFLSPEPSPASASQAQHRSLLGSHSPSKIPVRQSTRNKKAHDKLSATAPASMISVQNISAREPARQNVGNVSAREPVRQNVDDCSPPILSDTEDSEEGEGWREGDLQEIVFPEEPNLALPDEMKSPLEYFRYYFDDDLITLIVNETNLYSTQQSGKSINVTNDEILAFFGIMIYMGVCCLPCSTDYWSRDTIVTQISEVMPRNRYQQIHSKIHFHNNEEGGEDRLLKIRPLLDHIRKKCQGVEQEQQLSIDERMEGYKGTRAGSLRQYMPDKPSSRFGFKIFVLASKTGITYDFIPYTGQDTFDRENLTAEEKQMGVGAMAVIALCKSIKQPKKTHVTFDNFYTGLPLITYLKDNMELHSVGTIKRNRSKQCPLTDAKEFMKKGRGSFESRVNKNAIVVVQWADNKPVCLASSFVGVEPVGTVKRYSKDARSQVDVPCPRAVSIYNKTMGGVDLSDMLMALYKIPTRAKRYYFPFVGYCLEVALTNSWLQYKRDCNLLQVSKKEVIPSSKKFRLEVSEGLRVLLLKTKGQPSLDNSLTKKMIKQPVKPRPSSALRTDGCGHLPDTCTKGRCRYCTIGTSRIQCIKCNVRLCLNSDRNCFVQFHITEKGRLVPADKEESEDNAASEEADDEDEEFE